MIKVSRTDVKCVIEAACPRYKGRKIYIECDHIPTKLDSYWDEGYRNYYAFYDIRTQQVFNLPSNHPFYQPNRPRDMKALPVGVLLVCHHYCGTRQYVTIYCNAEDMPKRLN